MDAGARKKLRGCAQNGSLYAFIAIMFSPHALILPIGVPAGGQY